VIFRLAPVGCFGAAHEMPRDVAVVAAAAVAVAARGSRSGLQTSYGVLLLLLLLLCELQLFRHLADAFTYSNLFFHCRRNFPLVIHPNH